MTDQPIHLVKPPKPWAEMTADEKTAWAESIQTALAAEQDSAGPMPGSSGD